MFAYLSIVFIDSDDILYRKEKEMMLICRAQCEFRIFVIRIVAAMCVVDCVCVLCIAMIRSQTITYKPLAQQQYIASGEKRILFCFFSFSDSFHT